MVTQHELNTAVWRWWKLGEAQQGKPLCDVPMQERIAHSFAESEVIRLRRMGGEQLAAERGWQVSDWFGLQRLKQAKSLRGRREIEYNDDLCCHAPAINWRHVNWYALDGRAVALVTHTYNYSADREQIAEFVQRHGLHVEVLPWSWYSPQTTALLYTRAVSADADDFGELL